MGASKIACTIVRSPLGELIAGTTEKGCCLLEYQDRGGIERIRARIFRRYGAELIEGGGPMIDTVVRQLAEFFGGTRREFSIPLDLRGTPFEMSVWQALLRIPYGRTRTYGDIAAELGRPGASRAVGRANGANYCAIIVPCHRVVESDGGLRGYGGGLWRKRFLLDLERSAESLPFK